MDNYAKLGRPAFSLTPEEWKERREMQRKARKKKEAREEKEALLGGLVDLVTEKYEHYKKKAYEEHKDVEDAEIALAEYMSSLVNQLVADDTLTIKRKPTLKGVAGYNGERIRRA